MWNVLGPLESLSEENIEGMKGTNIPTAVSPRDFESLMNTDESKALTLVKVAGATNDASEKLVCSRLINKMRKWW